MIICYSVEHVDRIAIGYVMHRELPVAESADLTTYRYQPPRCLTTLGVIFFANNFRKK